jgi:hypothetical protein
MFQSKPNLRDTAREFSKALVEGQGAQAVMLCSRALACTNLQGRQRQLTELVALEVLGSVGSPRRNAMSGVETR